MEDLLLALRIYELCREEADDKTRFMEVVAEHVQRRAVHTAERDGNLVGVAFTWHIADPEDVRFLKSYPGETPQGKYLFLRLLYIAKDFRNHDGSVLKELFTKAFQTYQAAQRLAFFRISGRNGHMDGRRRRALGPRDTRRLHVLNVRGAYGRS